MVNLELTEYQQRVLDHVRGNMREDNEDPEVIIRTKYGGDVECYC